MTVDDLKTILRRWHTSHSISSIKEASGFDRNTIRNYINLFKANGFKPGCILPCEQELITCLQTMIPDKVRPRTIRQNFMHHKDEIISLITRKVEPVKPKTAFQIVKAKYDLKGSYETFKLFIREHAIEFKQPKTPLRIELPPGQEIQLDYGKVGMFFDPVEKRNRVVYAFCSRLSFSRLPFIEYVFSQNQESFVESNIDMLEFYQGASEFISIDNLKSGVIKPDMYDPHLNRAYREFSEHYKTFINPCRVAKPTDKGKVERLVPQARELFRRLKEVHPSFSLCELNDEALKWCRLEYGRTKHGTTGIAPLELFEEEERAKLIPLAAQRFEIPVWKTVKVHRDRFFAFEGRYYAMPYQYRDKSLQVRKNGAILRVFAPNFSLIREYVITGKRYSWLKGDFPDDREALMQGEYPRWLLSRATSFGPSTYKLIEAVLKPAAHINTRKARGILSALEKYRDHPFREEICGKALERRIFIPKQIVQMLEAEKLQNHFDFIIPMSNASKAMIRDVKEYFN